MKNYNKQALDFLNSVGATIEINFSHNGPHFQGDKDNRDIYNVIIRRSKRKMAFNFGQSLAKSGFYYTKGKQIVHLDRKLLDKKNLGSYIKRIDYSFLDNKKSDIIHSPIPPVEYDILACLQKYDVGTFEDFCNEFGYDSNLRSAEKTYNAVVKEYSNLCALFTAEELEVLREIN